MRRFDVLLSEGKGWREVLELVVSCELEWTAMLGGGMGHCAS